MIAFEAIVLGWPSVTTEVIVVNLPLTAEARLVHTYTARMNMVLLSIDRDCLRTWDVG